MSYSKTLLVSALLAVAEARFGQEQAPVAALQALSNVGQPGVAGTLTGSVPGVLLAAANPCDKLTLADKFVTELGDSQDVIDAVKGLVAAEQNFNPFVVSIPKICSDASLPATAALRGIVPLVDPSVGGADTENTNSATSKTTPFDATGLSVADIMKAHGFSNFTSAAADGSAANAGTGSGSSAGNSTGSADTNTNNASTASTGSTTTAAAGNGTAADVGGADFGSCTPTMDFQLGRGNRKATEGTFLPTDPKVAQGQQDALNPNIITNRICDQLTNVCDANAAAKTKCKDAQAQILASGDRSAAVADTWNQLLGF